MKGIANLNTRKALCGETHSNLGDRHLWEQGAAEPCQNWWQMLGRNAEVRSERALPRAPDTERSRDNGGEPRVQPQGKAHLGQEMGTQAGENQKQIKSHHQLWPSMMKGIATGNNEYSNAKTAQEPETGPNKKFTI